MRHLKKRDASELTTSERFNFVQQKRKNNNAKTKCDAKNSPSTNDVWEICLTMCGEDYVVSFGDGLKQILWMNGERRTYACTTRLNEHSNRTDSDIALSKTAIVLIMILHMKGKTALVLMVFKVYIRGL